MREFSYWVCEYNFNPIVCKIGTKENDIVDFWSRNIDPSCAKLLFESQNILPLNLIDISDNYFELIADC